jgi:hypothetical protein
MQTFLALRHAMAAAALLASSGCGSPDSPYDRIGDAPLVEARLHAVTLVSGSETVVQEIREAGYTPVKLAPNYARAVTVEASIWGVPEAAAAAIQDFKASRPGAPDLRLLVTPPAPPARVAAEGTEAAFFRNVLGVEVPVWPLAGNPSSELRVQVWTYLVPDVVAATRRFRESGIPVIYGPVGLTTSYLGDHRTLATRAPDGTVVQLVQTTAQ